MANGRRSAIPYKQFPERGVTFMKHHALKAVLISLGLILVVLPAMALVIPPGGGGSGGVGLPPGCQPNQPCVVQNPAESGIRGPISSVSGVILLFNSIVVWIAWAFWIAAAGFVFYAAFLYLTAAGSDERVKKAHKQLLYSVIAVAVGLMAYGLPYFVQNVLGCGSGGFGIFGLIFC